MQLLSYLTDAARIAPFREMARIIWINLLGQPSRRPHPHRFASHCPSARIRESVDCERPETLLWLVPDRRIERVLVKRERE